MGKIQSLPGSQVFFDRGPELDLGGVAEEVTNDRAAFQGFFDLEQGFARDEAVTNRFIPGFGILPLSDNDIYAVILLVQRLAGALDAIPDDGDGLIFQY